MSHVFHLQNIECCYHFFSILLEAHPQNGDPITSTKQTTVRTHGLLLYLSHLWSNLQLEVLILQRTVRIKTQAGELVKHCRVENLQFLSDIQEATLAEMVIQFYKVKIQIFSCTVACFVARLNFKAG